MQLQRGILENGCPEILGKFLKQRLERTNFSRVTSYGQVVSDFIP